MVKFFSDYNDNIDQAVDVSRCKCSYLVASGKFERIFSVSVIVNFSKSNTFIEFL